MWRTILTGNTDGYFLGPCSGNGTHGELRQRVSARVGTRAFETISQALAARCRNHARTRVGESLPLKEAQHELWLSMSIHEPMILLGCVCKPLSISVVGPLRTTPMS